MINIVEKNMIAKSDSKKCTYSAIFFVVIVLFSFSETSLAQVKGNFSGDFDRYINIQKNKEIEDKDLLKEKKLSIEKKENLQSKFLKPRSKKLTRFNWKNKVDKNLYKIKPGATIPVYIGDR